MNAKPAAFRLITTMFRFRNRETYFNPGSVTDYRDVFASTPYRDDIDVVCRRGLMTGTTARKFSPQALLTRAMAVETLYRLEGSPATDLVRPFKDVRKSSPAAKAVSWAAKHGIVNGYDEILFGPDDYITKEQLARLFQNYAHYRGYDTSAPLRLDHYKDQKAMKEWARTAMAWAVGSGLFHSKNPLKLDAMCRLTRGEFASMVVRFGDLYHID